MGHFDKLKRQVRQYIFLLGFLTVIIMVGGSWEARRMWPNHDNIISLALLVVGGLGVWLVAVLLANYALQPLDVVWRAILHVTPGHEDTTPPNLDKNKIGQELVTTLALQVYQLASTSPTKTNSDQDKVRQITQGAANNLPLPLFAINNKQIITYCNEAASKFLGLPLSNLLGQNFYSVADLAFHDDKTLDNWLQDCRANKVKDSHAWQRVRLKLADSTLKQFDLAASYNKDDPGGTELLVTIFDQSGRYGSEDDSLDFVAMTVHELRTPLTALRGYIEVLEDELSGQVDPELATFIQKMRVAAQQLSIFVGNVLKVARIQDGQLSLNLAEENWGMVIKEAVTNLAPLARIHGKTINYQIDANVPTVGVDKTSITEVINNLADNAIKYSGGSQVITIRSWLGQDGLVQTSVHDDGVGIAAAVLPTLFQKFQRNYHNSAKIGGTGLGLYLCSALVKAQGGNIWIESKEGQGTTVSFTLQPYAQLAAELKNTDNKDITRNAHGWIKNHSLYRR